MIQTSGRAALYASFSSDNQRSESIDAQIRAMTAYCGQRHIAIVETYVDEARSAMTDRRPSFQQMVADSSHHSFNIDKGVVADVLGIVRLIAAQRRRGQTEPRAALRDLERFESSRTTPITQTVAGCAG